MRREEQRMAKELTKQVAVPSIHLSASEAKKEAENYFDSLSSQVHKTAKVWSGTSRRISVNLPSGVGSRADC